MFLVVIVLCKISVRRFAVGRRLKSPVRIVIRVGSVRRVGSERERRVSRAIEQQSNRADSRRETFYSPHKARSLKVYS